MKALQTAATDTIQIRSMKPEDLEQVMVIERASFSLPWPANAYNYELENPLSMLWVAEDSTPGDQPRVIGMAVVWFVLDEAHIATLAIQPEYRGRGIAQRLMVVALRDAIYKGAVVATLEVRAGNLIAQQLYRRFRFEVVGRRPRYYRDNNEDALIMTANNLGNEYLRWLESGAWRKNEP